MLKNEFGLKIKELRIKKSMQLGSKYNQSDLAEDLGISRSYLGDIESGRIKPNLEIQHKICEVFGIDSLFDENEVSYYSTVDIPPISKKIISLLLEDSFTDKELKMIDDYCDYLLYKKYKK